MSTVDLDGAAIPALTSAHSLPDIALTPVMTTVRKVYGEINTGASSPSSSSSAVIGISVMAQHFTDRVWICVNEVNPFNPEGDKMRPGSIIVGTPAPFMTTAHTANASGDGIFGGAGGGGGDACCLTSPDELEVVLGDRDDPLTNVLSAHIFNIVAESSPGKGMCLCLSTRKLTRALTTPDVKKAAVDGILSLVISALGEDMDIQ